MAPLPLSRHPWRAQSRSARTAFHGSVSGRGAQSSSLVPRRLLVARYEPQRNHISDNRYYVTQGNEEHDIIWGPLSDVVSFCGFRGVHAAGTPEPGADPWRRKIGPSMARRARRSPGLASRGRRTSRTPAPPCFPAPAAAAPPTPSPLSFYPSPRHPSSPSPYFLLPLIAPPPAPYPRISPPARPSLRPSTSLLPSLSSAPFPHLPIMFEFLDSSWRSNTTAAVLPPPLARNLIRFKLTSLCSSSFQPRNRC